MALQLHANPADSPEDQAEQRMIIETVNRTLDYAHKKGVTLVGSLGNNHEDLGKPRTDISSPDYPPGTEYDRPIDNSDCVDLPVEGPHVIGVSALGPSETKADYSNYGVEQISVPRLAAGSVTGSARRRTARTRTRSCRATRSTFCSSSAPGSSTASASSAPWTRAATSPRVAPLSES